MYLTLWLIDYLKNARPNQSNNDDPSLYDIYSSLMVMNSKKIAPIYLLSLPGASIFWPFVIAYTWYYTSTEFLIASRNLLEMN